MATLPLPTNVHQAVVDAIDQRRPLVMAVVLKTSGSVPREAGTRALIDGNGAILGTIGGGLLEAEAQRLAADALRTMRPATFELRFTGASAEVADPVCGGWMRVLIDPTDARHREAYAQAAEAARRRQRGVLVTSIGEGETPQVTAQWFSATAVPVNGDDPPTVAMRAALARGCAQCFGFEATRSHEIEAGLAESVTPSARLLISGGGHVGQALAAQASLVGFEVVVVEDRAPFADASLYPDGVTTRCGEFADALAEFGIDPDTYIAIVGRGHRVDMKALAACIESPAPYIGMMGSRRKVALVRKAFLESGQATAEKFARVYAPIGLNLGGETVPEIAASIVAQLVAVRRTGRAPRFE